MAELLAKRPLADLSPLIRAGLDARVLGGTRAFSLSGEYPGKDAIALEPGRWLVLAENGPAGGQDITSAYALFAIRGSRWATLLDVAPLVKSGGEGFTARIASLRAHVLPLAEGAIVVVERPYAAWFAAWLEHRLLRMGDAAVLY